MHLDVLHHRCHCLCSTWTCLHHCTGGSAGPGRVYTTEACSSPGPGQYRGLRCTWTCLQYRCYCLCCTWTCLHSEACAAPGRVFTSEACAAPGPVYTTEAYAAPGRVYTTGAYAACGRVSNTEVCAAPGPVYSTET
jgi:hypothetical protein